MYLIATLLETQSPISIEVLPAIENSYNVVREKYIQSGLIKKARLGTRRNILREKILNRFGVS